MVAKSARITSLHKSALRFGSALLILFSFAAKLEAQTDSPSPVTNQESALKGAAWIIPIRGDIEQAIQVFVRRETRAALNAGAAFIVYEIDTFGGRVDTALEISSFIGSVKNAETIAWVHSGPDSMGVSWSAGALIALSCSSIYMASGTSIGAAAPVELGADGAAEPSGEKTVSAVRAQMAALAEKNEYPAAIALAMVDKDIELWELEIDGTTRMATAAEADRLEREIGNSVKRLSVVSSEGKLLSLTAGEAVRYGLARDVANDQESLLVKLGASSPALVRGIGFFDQLVAFLSSSAVQALFILVGIVALFLEINTPGFGIPGVIALVAFLFVFGINALLGAVGSLELILFLIGVGLLTVEIFVLPGFGVAGVSGFVAIGAALIFSMQDFVIPAAEWQWDLFGRNAITVVLAIFAAIIGIAVLAMFGPKLRMFNWLVLKTRLVGGAAGDAVITSSEDAPNDDSRGLFSDAGSGNAIPLGLIGRSGIAVSTLRPSGKAEIDGKVYVVDSDGVFIEAGQSVIVDRVRGNQVFVKAAAQRG